jgi:autotransporter-associated beta strand protein
LWSTSGNWIDASTGATQAASGAPGVRGVTGDTVLFASAAGSVAQLDGANPSLAAITFNPSNNAATSYTIEGSGGSITLQGGAPAQRVGGATVSVSARSDTSDTIDARVHLASNTTFNAAAASTLTIAGPIDGSGSLTMTGGGKLVLSAANTFSGGLIVQSGKVVIGVASGLLNGSSLIVGAANAFNSPLNDSTAVAPIDSPTAISAAAVLLDCLAEDSISATSVTRGLSPRAVAVVLAAGPSVSPAPSWIRRFQHEGSSCDLQPVHGTPEQANRVK